ncbi:MAG: transglutaminase-like domain-containing protein [Thermodesulfobacteriota bacterium]|nr:transglutaminase-like domain-containing protein [Thermodesulfobacteriota bacterium]
MKKIYFTQEMTTSSNSLYVDVQQQDVSNEEEWMGIYIKGKKIGYAMTSTTKVAEGYQVVEQLFMQLLVMGSYKRITSVLHSLVREDFSIQSFELVLHAESVVFKIKGEVVGKRLKLKIFTGGEEREETLPLKRIPHLSSGISGFLAHEGFVVGKECALSIFDPSTMSQNNVTVKVEKREKIMMGSEEIVAYRLRTSYGGVDLYTWVTPDGVRLKEEGFLGITLLREDKDKACKVDETIKMDLIELSKISSNVEIKKPHALKSLKIRLTNMNVDNFSLSGTRQQQSEDVVEITRENIDEIPNFELPYTESEYAEYLVATSLLQSDAPQLIREAKRIIGSEKDALQAVQLFSQWMSTHVKKNPTFSVPSALEVLRSRIGDCNEHAALFTALCRAVGIPAKVCVGIVYSEGDFYYHAWSEVYLGKWVSVDPLMNQLPADVTHIKFVEGELEDQMGLMEVVGKLKVEVLEYQ